MVKKLLIVCGLLVGFTAFAEPFRVQEAQRLGLDLDRVDEGVLR